MKLTDFKIGEKFWMCGRRYMCADVGKRCVVAVYYDVGQPIARTEVRVKNGKRVVRKFVSNRTIKEFKQMFPDGFTETIIYSYDWPACDKTKTAYQRESSNWRKVNHDTHNRTRK